MERDTTVVTGYINKLEKMEGETKTDDEGTKQELPLSSADVYKELRLRGYNYKGVFQGIAGATYDGKHKI